MATAKDTPRIPPRLPEWATGAIYQIVVPSYADADGDGMGDLKGVANRLEYLKWLGVGAFWLSPIYPSPMLDLGYDVADYVNINPRLGALEDFQSLVVEAHRRDLRVILDFIPNHTSDRHPWFQASRSSRLDAHRDWYLWRDPAPDGGPPNNWTNQYEESDWTWDAATSQYYLHSFMSEQPDLNWWNPEVGAAMKNVLRFWLDQGVDGFRIDAMVHLFKDERLRDNPAAPGSSADKWPAWHMLPAYSQDVGGLQSVIRELCEVVREYPGRIIIGENHLSPERLALYYRSGVSLPVNSQLLDLAWDPLNIRRMVDRYEGFLTADDWPNWVLGSHDNQRVAGYLGADRARIAAMLQLTLRGTPIIYYGEELGMPNVEISPEQERDPLATRMPGKGKGRDAQRTPMQWSDEANAGFTTGEPWLPIGPDYRTLNVQAEQADPRSMLHLYRGLLKLRAAHEALRLGHYTPGSADEGSLTFVRETNRAKLLVALNFRSEPIELNPRAGAGRILLSTRLDREHELVSRRISLRANEGAIVELNRPA